MCELSCRNTTGPSAELPRPRALQPPWPVAEGIGDPPRVAPGTGRGNIGLFGGETSCSPPVSSHHGSRALPTQEPHKRDRVSCFLKNIYINTCLFVVLFSLVAPTSIQAGSWAGRDLLHPPSTGAWKPLQAPASALAGVLHPASCSPPEGSQGAVGSETGASKARLHKTK